MQPGEFAAADAGVGGEVKGGVEPLGGYVSEECGELSSVPDGGDRGAWVWSWWPGLGGGVGVDEAAVDSEVERVGDRPVDFQDGFGARPALRRPPW